MEKRVRISRLMDRYGAELTKQQAEVLAAVYDEDMSLAEIAAGLGISRQAAHDAQKRGVARLEELESALGAEAESERLARELRLAREAVASGDTALAIGILDRLIDR